MSTSIHDLPASSLNPYRGRPLLERKALLRKLVPLSPQALRYVEHFASGTDLFRVICEQDMDGVVAKQAAGLYTPEATTWVKIKNPAYSQAEGRREFFNRRRARG
jgi:ATP-dependent DNA ligase